MSYILKFLDYLFGKMKLRKPSDDAWTLAEVSEDGLPVLFRFRNSVPKGVTEKDFPISLSILWEYQIEGGSGMPTSGQNDEHLKFDDALDNIEMTGVGKMMLAITGNGRKEWIWYVSDAESWLEELHKNLEGHQVYPIDIEKSEDPEWKTWKHFRDRTK